MGSPRFSIPNRPNANPLALKGQLYLPQTKPHRAINNHHPTHSGVLSSSTTNQIQTARSMSFTNRNKIQNSRGPNRHRWEPKQPTPSVEKVTMVGIGVLGCFLMFVFLLQTWSSSHHGFLRSSDPTTLHHLPLRGHRINHAESHLILPNSYTIFLQNQPLPIADAIVVGSGLAGLTAALTILDRGGTVLIVEKEPIMGGNSNKASSGINGCCWDQKHQTHPVSSATNDTLELFMQDTLRSAGTVADEELIETLVTHSAPTLDWLEERVGVDLTAPLVILGGHSRKRTHRPNIGFVGAEIMNAMETAIRSFEMDGSVQILVGHKVTRIIQDTHGTVKGVEVESVEESSYENTPPQNLLLRSDHVILATGGFASDRSQNSLLRQYRPELQNMAATAGTFSTGDGIHLAEQLQAATRDMEKIQIHPTGFVDPTDPRNPQKVLAAELLRGVGGILINSRGERFANELGTRDYVTDRMLQHDDEFRRRRTWNPDTPIPQFDILLSSTAAKKAEKHVDTYMRKGLIHKFYGINELARNLQVSQDRLASTIRNYQLAAMGEREDAFGRGAFENVFDWDLEDQDFYVGVVTPVLHYCMGGIKINPQGQVLSTRGGEISGLHAIGEVTGGVHGNNRLGGNSLLECAVFGRMVGKHIPVHGYRDESLRLIPSLESTMVLTPKLNWSFTELSLHDTPDDCLIALHGEIFNLTSFQDHHPGGSRSITSLCGNDGSDIFSAAHSSNILQRVERHSVGHLADKAPKPMVEVEALQPISKEMLEEHHSFEDCWMVIHGNVYDLSDFSKNHPGGAYLIQKMAGKDATKTFSVFHHQDKLKLAEPYLVGKYLEST